jgi:mono/diheme cytochrome c family protein
MRQLFGVSTTVALLSACLAAVPAAAVQAPQPQRPAADGRAVYNAQCARCHGRNGAARPDYAKKGTPDLNDPEWQKARSDAEIRELIAKGSPGTVMEAYADKLSAAEIDALVKHVRKLGPPAPR